VEVQSDSRPALAGLGYALSAKYLRTQDPADLRAAADYFLKASEIGLAFGGLHYTREIAYRLGQLGDREGLYAFFSSALATGQNPYRTHLHFAEGWAQLDDPTTEGWFQKALTLQPHDSLDAVAFYGDWLLARGQWDKVLAIIPSAGAFDYLLLLRGVALERMGELDRARQAYARYAFEAWAPDGSRFLYEEMAGTNAPLELARPALFVWDVTKHQGHEILPNVWGAGWSSTGEIAVRLVGNPIRDAQGRVTGTDFLPGQPFRAWMGVLDGSTYEVKTLFPIGEVTDIGAFLAGPNLFWCATRPVWSPDGAQLVYWDTQGRVWVTTADGQRRWLLEAEGGGYAVTWSPDGEWLALGLEEKLLLLPRPGGNP
jgi:hypothetical protein